MAPERDLSRAPLFQVMLVLQNTPAEALELPGLKLELEEIDAATAKLDLTLSMTETGDRLEGFWEYDRNLFDPTTVQRLVLQFEQLAQAAAAAAARPLSELPLLTAGERQQLIEWNDTGASTPGRTESKTLSQLFAEQAVRTPDAIALVAGSECLSYRHLAGRSARLARHLRRLGVGPETNVGIFLQRSPQLVTALLAVLEAGGAYIPLDPEYPQERVAFTLDDAQASLVLTQQALASRLPQAVSRRVLDAEPPDAESPASEPPDAESPDTEQLSEEFDRPGDSSIGPGPLAYVIYTSGSTGRPKGVAIEHRHAVAMVRWATHTYAPRELTGVLASTSVCFDLSVFEIFVPLACGGTVILAPDALSLADQPARVSLVNTVPSAMAELVRADHLPTSVRTINLAGEPLKRSLVEPLYGAAGSGTRLYNLYGPSEDTTYSTFTAVAAGNAAEPTIGRPIARTQAHVVDGRQHQVPIAVAGELVLGGAGVARGYLRRPGLTAERFVPDALGRGLGQRLYRTGDLARFTPAGDLEFLGRTDHQVKIRGFRIELGEIESALCEHPAVVEAVVVTRHDLTGATAEEPTSEALLVAYVVTMSESPGSGALRRHLERRLPADMTPSKFVELAAMPLTPNGKIDRRALPAPDPSRRDVENRWMAPRTPVEELLATIWCDLLAVERVGVDDNFFELGGHSLLASQMAVRVERAIGWEPSLKQIFEQPTIATLAASAESVTPSEPLRPLNRTGAMPLSFAQQRLWFLDRLEPGSAAYNVPVAVRLQGRVVAAALAAACSEMVRRHQVLRTVFELVAGEPMQRVVPSRPLPLPVIDLQALPAAAREAEAHALIESEACRPFDLELAPLLRIQLLSLGPEANVLLANMHHIAADGWSIGLMLNELARLYDAAVRNRSSSLPTLPIQYADFAVWQREQLAGERLDAELGYWRQKLAGAPEVLELPTDRPRSTQLTSRSGRHRAMLPASLVRRLKALAQSTSTTPYMTLLAVLGALLSRSTGQRDLIVGSPIANRGPIETEKLIGFFVNTLALRLDLTSDPSFIELLERVRSAALGAYAHQQLPFEKLVEQLSDGRDLSHAPLVQVVLALQNAPIRMPQLPGIEVEIEELTPATAKFDLTVSLVETNGRLEGFWEYDRDLFDATTIRRLAEQFENLAASAVASPQQRLNAMSWLTANERQALREWNDTASRYPREAPIHRLFETWAASTPEAIAVVCGDQQLSYRELDRQANRLGHHFRACGVGPEVCVGLCVERSIEMVVSILGILKAGGIYVPLDPDYPPERLAFMLEDVQASVVVIAGKLAGRLTLPQTTPSLRVVDLEAGTLGRYGTDRPDVEVAPENLAYVMFTSGSTGRPKGVAVAHHNVARLVRSTRYANLDSEQVFLQFAPVSFDAATLEIWGPLANGGRLVVFPPHTPSLSELGGFLESRRVSTLWLTAGLFHRMAGENLATLGALDQLLAGGDVLSSRHVRRVLDDNPHCTVINGYGPTENTTFTTCATMRDASDVADPVSIGRPIANTTVHVLDEALRVQAIGVFGHLYIGGEGLARGYARQAARTAERFVPSPLSARPGRRLYDSGDLARWRPDGSLEFQGRSDHQVKIRGFRIELGEIESVLTQHPGVTQATVLARRDRAPGQSEAAFDEARLVAYFVPGDQEPNERALRQLLASQLPSYMVPAAFVSLAALPLTANGKIDRRALPAFDGARPDLEKPFVAPRTAVEEMLAELWSDLLEVNRIGVHDDFFELGGHSLLAIQLLGRLRDDFGVDLPVRALFEAPSIEGLSRALAEALLAQADERAAEQALAEVEQQHG
ncbi:MAG: amino acid adenylation domain-containing protein [Acidobacteriota bacterium]